MKQTSFTSLLLLAAAICPVFAGPLKEAKISQIINDVKVVEPRRGARPAALQELIKDDLGVATGIQSRAELLFQDNTLTRLGAETFFSFEPGTRNLKLDRGSMLLQVPKGLGGARIRAASVSASITGTTIMVEHLSGQRVKIVVLEGGLRVGVDRRPAASLMLQAGKMVIIGPDARELPKPVDVDLRKLVRTSALIDPVLFNGKTRGSAAALPSMGLIEKEIAQQEAKPNDDAPATGADGTQIAGESRAPLDTTHLATSIGKTETPLPKTVITPDLNAPAPTVPNPASAADTSTPVGTEPANGTAAGTGTSSTTSTGTGTTAGRSAFAGSFAVTTTPPPTAPTPTVPTPTVPTTLPPTASTAPAFIAIPNPYLITNKTTITTATQMIATRGVVDAGGLYQSAAASGPASAYVFDTPSAFDTARSFDSRFSMMSGGTAPSSGVAVYRFAGLELQGPPTFSVAGGPTDIALVSQSGIASGTTGSAWQVDALRSLFFGSANGPITLSNTIQSSFFSGFKYVQVYARGASGAVTLDGKIETPFASLYVDAEQGITVSNCATITAFKTVFNTPGAIVMNASPVSAMLQLTSGTGIQFTQALANASVEMTAPRLQTTADLFALTGFLNIGAGGIQAGGSSLDGFDRIAVTGNVQAGNVRVSNTLNIGGTFTTGAPSGQATLSASTIVIGGGIDLTAAAGPNGGTLTVNATDVNVAPGGINGIRADGAAAKNSTSPGGNGGPVNLGTSTRPIANGVNVAAPISATTGANGAASATGGLGGSVNIVANGTIGVGSSVKVSDSTPGRASSQGGSIRLASRKTTGTAIAINNSGQLLALLSSAAPGPGGTIQFTSAGGDIRVNGGKIQADRGSVDIRNNGPAGLIQFTNATLSGDVVKVGALGANGQLIIGGGTLSADTSLKLYGGSSNGQVHFTDNVTLGGNGAKHIAGKTVTIDNGKTVTVGGGSAANVYTANPNYTGSGGNGSTSGAFGGKGATTQGFASRPAF